jgi:hypothetical protein
MILDWRSRLPSFHVSQYPGTRSHCRQPVESCCKVQSSWFFLHCLTDSDNFTAADFGDFHAVFPMTEMVETIARHRDKFTATFFAAANDSWALGHRQSPYFVSLISIQ